MSTIRPISEKQLEANRRNASQSTGPKTEAGKQASRMNAVTHGLLAKAVVITAGDYQEDEQEFGQLLEDLREQFTPVGVAEDLKSRRSPSATGARCARSGMSTGPSGSGPAICGSARSAGMSSTSTLR